MTREERLTTRNYFGVAELSKYSHKMVASKAQIEEGRVRKKVEKHIERKALKNNLKEVWED